MLKSLDGFLEVWIKAVTFGHYGDVGGDTFSGKVDLAVLASTG
jgi:hypothetical protein